MLLLYPVTRATPTDTAVVVGGCQHDFLFMDCHMGVIFEFDFDDVFLD